MAWIDPNWDDKKYSNVNEELALVKGELSEEDARTWLGKFLIYNIQFTMEIVLGIKLHPRQAVLMKAWFYHNYCLAVWGRGGGKSTLIGFWAVLDCIFNPNTHTLIVSQNFRSSRRILENLEKLANAPEGALFKQCIKGELSRRNDIFKYTFLNGSTLTAVPLSGGDGLRGQRCSRLIIDEAVLISLGMIDTILKPFLVAGGDIKQKLKLRELEDKLIAKGYMDEADRQIFGSTSKMILLSSASYQWEDLYKIYEQYLKTINDAKEEDIKVASYCITQIGYKAIPEDLLDKGVIQDVESGNISQSILDREYGAIFVSDSSGYYSAKKMSLCTIPDGQFPIVEITGERGEEYVLGIDLSWSSGEDSDNFAMSLMKLVKRPDGKRIGMLVHSYSVAGGNLKDHIAYLHYILTNFNVVYIGVDASQGDNEFTTSANESKLFKDAGIELKDIDADFNKVDMSELIGQVAKSYNFQARRIVHKQHFGSDWQRAANEYLQACIDYKGVLFAGKAAATDAIQHLTANKLEILNIHPEFKDEGMHYFVELQDGLIDQTKRECALIEVKGSPTGGQQFGLPVSMSRSKSKSRQRKDNYSSFLLANWCVKVYVEAMAKPREETHNNFVARMV
jgi:hypothetical protein